MTLPQAFEHVRGAIEVDADGEITRGWLSRPTGATAAITLGPGRQRSDNGVACPGTWCASLVFFLLHRRLSTYP